MFSLKKLLLFFFLSVFAFWGGRYVTAVSAEVNTNPNVSFCHASPADTASEGYEYITTDANSLINPRGSGGQHITEHDADIIPPFTYYTHDGRVYTPHQYGGKNWDQGEPIFENNCVVPQEVDCQLSDWSECSAVCGGGIQTRTIIQEPQNGGQACGDLTRSCNTQPCDPAGQCPTTCGYQGGTVPDGKGGVINCTPTSACEVVPTPTPEPTNPPVGGQSGPPGPPVCNSQQPSAPRLLSVTKTSSTSVLLKWSLVSPASYYVISYGTDPNNLQFGVPNAGNTDNFTIGALNPNVKYYFVVRAVNDCMPSDPSNQLSSGTVLAASTQVLGASTDKLADTGSNLYLPRIMVATVAFVLSLTSGVKLLHVSKRN